MGRKGDLLELIDGAPLGLQSLTGSLWKWRHNERFRQAVDHLSQRRGTSISHHIAIGGPVSETSDEHLRVWLVLPDHWRIESPAGMDLNNGVSRWFGSSTQITEIDHGGSTVDGGELGVLVQPGVHLIGVIRFGVPVDDEVSGRQCLRVDGTTERNHHDMRPMSLGMQLGGIDHQFWFDTETGIILRHVGLFQDEPCAITELKDLAINQPIPDDVFTFVLPPGAALVRQVDQMIQLAEMRGVDLTGVDRTDLAAIRSAVSAGMRPNAPTPQARIDMQKAKHIPVGPPPDDEAAARSSIEYAYAHCADTNDAGDVLINVQGEPGLVESLKQARQRIPGSPDGDAKMVVDDIMFLRSDEAIVWFSLEIDGRRLGYVAGREGRAILEGDRWLVEHATLVDLIGMAGVVVPPPSS
jgi:hypothetical protein